MAEQPSVVDTDELAAEVAKDLADRIDQLSLIGYRFSFDEAERAVVETTLRLGVRLHLERLLD